MGLFGPSKKMLDDFGKVSQLLIDAVSHGEDLADFMDATATVGIIIKVIKQHYGFIPVTGSTFDRARKLVLSEDVDGLLEITREMAKALSAVSIVRGRGEMMDFWLRK